jgi:hypothetical protein
MVLAKFQAARRSPADAPRIAGAFVLFVIAAFVAPSAAAWTYSQNLAPGVDLSWEPHNDGIAFQLAVEGTW